MKALHTICLASALVACEQPTPPTPAPPAPPEVAATPVVDGPRRVIDTHTHLSPMVYDGFLKIIDGIRIERVVNMSGGSALETRIENLAAADRYPGRIALFHNIQWDGIDDPAFGEREAAALEESVRSGFAGLKVSKALGLGVRMEDGELLRVDDERLDPIWAKAGELGVPVAIHTSDPKAFFEPTTPDNERYAELSLAPGWSFYGGDFPSRASLLAARDRVVARHRETTFILLHFGNNPEDVDYVDRLLTNNPNAVVDTAARIGEFGRHDAAKMREMFERHQDRILFATDMMMSVRPGPSGQAMLRLTLGSISEKPPGPDDIAPFYARHFQYFETSGPPIEHPVPIQGAWKVNPIGLAAPLLEKLYSANAERVIMSPWLGRRAAHEVASNAATIASLR